MQATLLGLSHHLHSLEVDPSTVEIEQSDHFGAVHRYVMTWSITTALPGEPPVPTEAFFAPASLSVDETAALTAEAFARDGYGPQQL